MAIVVVFILGCIVGAVLLACYSMIVISGDDRLLEDEEQEEQIKGSNKTEY